MTSTPPTNQQPTGQGATTTSTSTNTPNKFRLSVIAIFIPPIAVYFTGCQFHAAFWINIALCFLGWIPGVAHAYWIIWKH
ncbi:hypothetical protein EDB86DRAFT_2903819 [Lactarius hatsudake]|nr:hypothetical protein EDB86DRAFT_2903819 [Lactarius hatsudake]